MVFGFTAPQDGVTFPSNFLSIPQSYWGIVYIMEMESL